MRAPRTQGTAESNCELPDTTVPGERLEKASDVVGWHTSERTTIAFEYSEGWIGIGGTFPTSLALPNAI